MGYYKKFLNDHHKTLREITHVWLSCGRIKQNKIILKRIISYKKLVKIFFQNLII